MDRDFRQVQRVFAGNFEFTPAAGNPVGFGPLVCFRQQYGDHSEHTDDQERADHHTGHGQILLGVVIDNPDGDRGCCIDHNGQQGAPTCSQRAAVDEENSQHQRGDRHRDSCQYMPFRNAHDRLCELEFRIAIRVVYAPIRTDSAFGPRLAFPRLVERFHHVINVVLSIGAS